MNKTKINFNAQRLTKKESKKNNFQNIVNEKLQNVVSCEVAAKRVKLLQAYMYILKVRIIFHTSTSLAYKVHALIKSVLYSEVISYKQIFEKFQKSDQEKIFCFK